MNRREIVNQIYNRGYGLVAIVLGGIFVSSGHPVVIAGGTIIATEGLGDLISGEHHYLGSRALEYISGGKIRK